MWFFFILVASTYSVSFLSSLPQPSVILFYPCCLNLFLFLFIIVASTFSDSVLLPLPQPILIPFYLRCLNLFVFLFMFVASTYSGSNISPHQVARMDGSRELASATSFTRLQGVSGQPWRSAPGRGQAWPMSSPGRRAISYPNFSLLTLVNYNLIIISKWLPV